jgi:hypothetical protein
MKARIIAAVFISSVAVTSGCSKKCKNPKWIDDTEGSGPAVQCHAVVICPKYGGRGESRQVLQGGNDPIIVDRRSESWNINRCIKKVTEKGICIGGRVEASPEIICLDATGGPDGSDGRSSTGIFVTVGAAGVGSGDYLLYDGAGGAGGSGGLGGAAGADAFSVIPGAESQGEI